MAVRRNVYIFKGDCGVAQPTAAVIHARLNAEPYRTPDFELVYPAREAADIEIIVPAGGVIADKAAVVIRQDGENFASVRFRLCRGFDC